MLNFCTFNNQDLAELEKQWCRRDGYSTLQSKIANERFLTITSSKYFLINAQKAKQLLSTVNLCIKHKNEEI